MTTIHVTAVSGVFSIPVSDTETFGDIKKKVHQASGIDVAEQDWSIKDEIFTTLGMLATSSEDENDVKKEVAPKTPAMLTDKSQVFFQVGAGKRKAGKMAGKIEDNREERLQEKADELWSFKSKIEASGASGHGISYLLEELCVVYNKAQKNPDTICQDYVNKMTGVVAKKVMKDFADLNSNKPELKINILSKVFFAEHLRDLRNASRQINEAVQMTQTATELILVAQLADEGGNVAWRILSEMLANRHKNAPTVAQGTNTERNERDDEHEISDVDMGGSGDDGADNDGGKGKKKGRGKPKKRDTI
eukprot:Skav229491  [mRNA]  locus=scaffold2455:9876:10793:+ [translate_table: standard]